MAEKKSQTEAKKFLEDTSKDGAKVESPKAIEPKTGSADQAAVKEQPKTEPKVEPKKKEKSEAKKKDYSGVPRKFRKFVK